MLLKQNFSGTEIWFAPVFVKFQDPPLGNKRFLLQIYTRMHGFKYEFSKIFWGGAHRAPSPDPSPRLISGFALDSGFALNSRALRALDSSFALNSPPPTCTFWAKQQRGNGQTQFAPPTSTSWLYATDLLSLTVTKTSFIVFGYKNNLDLQIYVNNMLIERQNDVKFLGVILSNDLKWNKHVDFVVNKITKTIGIISKVRHFLPISTTRTLYLTLVEPYINYCNLVWALPHPTVSLDKIYKIQKRYCRIINFAHYRAHSEPLFQNLSILNIYKIYQTQSTCTNKLIISCLTIIWSNS